MAYILGVKVDAVTRQQAIDRVAEMMTGGEQHYITTPNPEMLVAAQKDAEFRDILNRSSLALPDGFGLILAGRLLGTPLPERIAGSDFVFDIARFAGRNEYSMYLLGGRGDVAERAAEKLIARFPDLKIVGAESGPAFPSSRAQSAAADEAEGSHTNVCKRILDAAPDILLVALGHGKQEKWIAAHLTELPSVKIAMGVGGAFDFIAGRVRRAPKLMRALGLEWLWRLFLQPWRILRIYRAVIVFSALLLRKYLTPRLK